MSRRIHIFEPDTQLCENMLEMLSLENFDCKSFTDFDTFKSQTYQLKPDIVICSLINCPGSGCHLTNYINAIGNARLIVLGPMRDRSCTCSHEKILLKAPFTYSELIACVKG